MFRKITIRARVFLLLTVFLLFILGILLFNARSTMQSNDEAVLHLQAVMLDGEKETLKVATHSLALAISSQLTGIRDKETQHRFIQDAVAQVRFKKDRSGYFFAYEGTTNVAHPIEKSIVGSDRGQTKDKNGKTYVRELKKAAASGGSFVDYVYNKPGQGDQPKLAYAEMIPGTPYWVGTGVYIDNIEKHKQMLQQKFDSSMKNSMLIQMSIIGVMLLFGFAPFCLFLVRSIVFPVQKANEVAQQIADGNLNVTIETEGNDEIAELQASLTIMAETLRENVDDMAAKETEANRQAAIARDTS